MQKLTFVAAVLATAAVSAQAMAQYPDGNGWQAAAQDFQTVFSDLGDIDGDLSALQSDITAIKDDVATIEADVGVVKSDVAIIKSKVGTIETGLATLNSTVSDLADAVAAVEHGFDVDIFVDTEICELGPAQCLTFTNDVPANDDNGNPVSLRALVTHNGVPVNGLGFDDFDFTPVSGAPGGFGASLCDNIDCPNSHFTATAVGTYGMLLVPADLGDWDAAKYTGVLTVMDDGGTEGAKLVGFEIPEAPAP